MDIKKELYISDVHLGAGRFSEESKDKSRYEFDWDWLSEEETSNFEEFLRYLRLTHYKEIKTVVLLGDIFDNWVFPHDLVPPTMKELIHADKNKGVVEELKLLSQKVEVFYVPGNHDMHATKDLMNEEFKHIKYCPEQYVNYRLIAEHGHRYAMFNAPARFSGNYFGLPLGYFISRIEASKKAITNRNIRAYQTYIDDFIELGGKPTLSQCVLEAVIEEAELSEDLAFTVKRENGEAHQISATDVKERYKNLFNDWPECTVSRHRAIFAELDMLGPVADKLCKNGKNKVCILGHSHKCELDKDAWFSKDRLYANSGFWCGSNCTFIEVQNEQDNYQVDILRWRGKEGLEPVESCSI